MYKIVLFLLLSINALAQVINPDSSITISLKDYKQIYYDYQFCDSTVNQFNLYISNTNKIISKKDSVININNLKIQSYEKEIIFKDSTLKQTNALLQSALNNTKVNNTKHKVSFISGFLLAILTIIALK